MIQKDYESVYIVIDKTALYQGRISLCNVDAQSISEASHSEGGLVKFFEGTQYVDHIASWKHIYKGKKDYLEAIHDAGYTDPRDHLNATHGPTAWGARIYADGTIAIGVPGCVCESTNFTLHEILSDEALSAVPEVLRTTPRSLMEALEAQIPEKPETDDVSENLRYARHMAEFAKTCHALLWHAAEDMVVDESFAEILKRGEDSMTAVAEMDFSEGLEAEDESIEGPC